ncbi:MAG: hypothetical protein ACD_81C00213G0003 [uncultured bacterium]|uniref:Uncharacterized protein n=2 Tax=Candidatus Wolfeibacteriota TaxID=1752735 RepID=A0A0G1H902_9BACT|nr:MAG: hypothetical protein ACD_81C00213G0003 [uncultured bacterium]KKR12922.1 MAG: hypothetical protein UT41_C0001G0466 [Candidatus Wolfebacteria bacterium GW2011_GWC2_39_22]KKT43851.1 MAG: hypothetical protein UW32_C0001G0443 [Candidatus Wolfebacteria bacterium GW2011_GWE2_44_13]HBI25422.1 hypothetical protein [Candidatus Wolfebacteria bacterium]
MDSEQIGDEVAKLANYGDLYRWATEKKGPTGIEPETLSQHIIEKVLQLLLFYEATPDALDIVGARLMILEEIEYFEETGRLRPAAD